MPDAANLADKSPRRELPRESPKHTKMNRCHARRFSPTPALTNDGSPGVRFRFGAYSVVLTTAEALAFADALADAAEQHRIAE